MRVLWKGESEPSPYCGANLLAVGIWSDEAARKALAPGQVYVVFSGDYDHPYKFEKIIRVDGSDQG